MNGEYTYEYGKYLWTENGERVTGNGELETGNGEEKEEEEGVTGNVFPEQAKNRTAIVFVTISMNGEYTYEYGKYVWTERVTGKRKQETGNGEEKEEEGVTGNVEGGTGSGERGRRRRRRGNG